MERITAWLDGNGLTLVPYKGRTLVADRRRDPVEGGDDRMIVPKAVEELNENLARCFPDLSQQKLRPLEVRA